MRLLALRLRDFRKFGEAAFAFAPGVNVVVGPNEAGKSTVRHAILTAFFANPATTAKRREEWRPWGSERLGWLSLEFELDGGRQLELRKDFERRKVEVRDRLTGQVLAEGAKAQERLLQHLGLATEGLYRATAMIEQAEIASLRVTKDEIGNRLSRIVQAGPGDAEAGEVIRRLERDLGELEKGLDRLTKTPGTIKGLQDDVAALHAQRDALHHRIARLEAYAEELRRLHDELEAAEQDLAIKGALLEENRDLLEMETELGPLRTRERELGERIEAVERSDRRLAELGTALEAIQAQGVPDDGAIAGLHALQGRVARQGEVVGEREAELEQARRQADRLRDAPVPDGQDRAVGRLGWVTVGAGFALLIAASAGPLPWPILGPLGTALVVLGIVGLGVRARVMARAETLRRDREAMRQRVADLQAGLAGAREALRRAEEALHAAVGTTGSATMAEALSRHQRLRALIAERTAIESQRGALLGDGDQDELRQALREARDRLRADIVGRERRLAGPEAQAKRLTALEVQTLEHEVVELTRRTHRMQARREHLERETAEGAPDYDALALLEERLAERLEMLEAARRRGRVYRLALEGLRTARQQTLIPARRMVEERAGEYLGILTTGAYDRVQIDEPPLRVQVWVPQGDRWMDPAEPALSRGTVDQVYLAVRLALVEVLSEGRRPPLLLDDPFATFDPARLQAALALLRRLSEHHQVLLFTCRPGYEPFADQTLTLGAADLPAPDEGLGPLWQPPAPPQMH